jgi:Transmembrane domain of unknown function (DUF3566)
MSSQAPQATQTQTIARPVATPVAKERRARLVVRRLDPWSVLKFSLLFYFCLLLVGILAFAAIWFVLANMGVFESIQNFAGQFNREVPIQAGPIFRWFVLLGLVGVVVWTLATVLITLLFNLVNDITGGVEVVLAESERKQRP